ncbi:MAG: NAD(P)-dependent oxidoreductase [Actinomycetota bacterium]|nr:NAD(P)-dependent oxidoreductase [Actinomycetota bacterium]
MRILITGGSGFLGSHIADEASHRGHEVVTFDRLPSSWRSAEQREIVGDILDFDALSNSMADCDAVYHCAAVADLGEARRDPKTAVSVNVLGTLAVMQAAQASGVHRLLHASSVYVYSRSGSVYRTTKRAAESLVSDLSKDFGLSTTLLRFGSLYGPRADADNAILRLTTQAVTEGRMDFWGDGSEVREYIHIRDAAALALDALSPEFDGQALHITGRERLTSRELVETIAETLGGEIDITFKDEPFEGRYRLTPFSHEDSLGRRIVSSTYIDLGLGLLEQIRMVSDERDPTP